MSNESNLSGRGMQINRFGRCVIGLDYGADVEANDIEPEQGTALYELVIAAWQRLASVKRHVLTLAGKEKTRGPIPEQFRFGARPGTAGAKQQRCMRWGQAVQDRAAGQADFRPWKRAA